MAAAMAQAARSRPQPPFALRGACPTSTGDPFRDGVAATRRYEGDGMLVVADGHIVDAGPASVVRRRLPPGIRVERLPRSALVVPGFVDCHVHYAQLPVIASHGAQLLDGLERYTFPSERSLADPARARAIADIGSADFAIQYNSPRQVARLIQRMGRAGHSVGAKSEGAIVASTPDEIAESLVITRKSTKEELEPLRVRENPLTVLANQLVAMTMAGTVEKEEAFGPWSAPIPSAIWPRGLSRACSSNWGGSGSYS